MLDSLRREVLHVDEVSATSLAEHHDRAHDSLGTRTFTTTYGSSMRSMHYASGICEGLRTTTIPPSVR